MRSLLVGALCLSALSAQAQEDAKTPPATPAADAPVQPPAPEAPAAAAETPPAPSVRKLTADDCVAIALRESGQVMEAEGKVTEWSGRLAEVQANWFPRLQGLTYLAPMYRATGTPADPDLTYNLGQWGPYFHLEAILAQPIFTFGRLSAGKKAASERLEVERARVRATKNVLALEVRKYYLLHLYAKAFKPVLESAKRILDEAEKTAQDLYKGGDGKVTNVNLMQLRYGGLELEKYREQADIGAELALAALKHTMGLPQSAELHLADETLPAPPTTELPALAVFIQKASQLRPEVDQLRHGEAAALSLEQAEKLSSMPVVFVAGQLKIDWTNMWPNVANPFYNDRYNEVSPGLAVGMQFDVDIAKTLAKAKTARGTIEQVEGLKKFAATGIPMEVRKNYDDAVQATRLLKLSDQASVAGRKWMIFAGSAYVAGTGEAKDVLEGLVAYLQGKKGYYDQLQALHLALASLHYATGTTGLPE